jgi:hypothetical protein
MSRGISQRCKFSQWALAMNMYQSKEEPEWCHAGGGATVSKVEPLSRLPDPAGEPGPSEPIALLCLGAGLFLGWSALFYLFGALLLPWELETALSKAELSLGLTAAIRCLSKELSVDFMRRL